MLFVALGTLTSTSLIESCDRVEKYIYILGYYSITA